MDYKDGEILGNRNVVETQVIHIYSEKKIPSLSIMSISVTISTFFPFLFVCFLFSLVRSGGAEQVHRRNLLRSRSSNASPLQPLIFTKKPPKNHLDRIVLRSCCLFSSNSKLSLLHQGPTSLITNNPYFSAPNLNV